MSSHHLAYPLAILVCASSLLTTSAARAWQFREIPGQEEEYSSILVTPDESIEAKAKEKEKPADEVAEPDASALEPAAPEPESVDEKVAPQEPAAAADESDPPDPESLAESFRNGVSTAQTANTASASTPSRPFRFNNVEPGKATLEELQAAWGPPAKTVALSDRDSVLIYKLEAFRQVDVHVREDVVSSLVIHLQEPRPLIDVVKELKLLKLVPVPIPDQSGNVLGQAYPERGMMFSFDADSEELKVAQILAEPVHGETFRLRAEYDFDRKYRRDLSDLDRALQLDPQDARAHWLKAELLSAIGRVTDALDNANSAVRLQPRDRQYQLTRARLLAATNDYDRGFRDTREIADDEDTPTHVRARAQCQLGDLTAMGPTPDFKASMKHHLAAIETAVKLADNERFEIRRAAKQVLAEAHLAVAYDVASGNFLRQQEVVPRWLKRGSALAEELVNNDNGDETLQLTVDRMTLLAFSALPGKFDPSVAVEDVLQKGRALIQDAADSLYQNQVELEMAEALFHAVWVERSRGHADTALRYANNAIALLENGAADRQDTPHVEFLQGRLYFAIGSLYAVEKNDHEEAVTWFEKAEPLVLRSLPKSTLSDVGEHGERLVSMGVTYWETDRRPKALRLTQQGAALMKQAVHAGRMDERTMSVPYGNLAAMHKQMGNDETAKEFARLAARLQPADEASRQR